MNHPKKDNPKWNQKRVSSLEWRWSKRLTTTLSLMIRATHLWTCHSMLTSLRNRLLEMMRFSGITLRSFLSQHAFKGIKLRWELPNLSLIMRRRNHNLNSSWMLLFKMKRSIQPCQLHNNKITAATFYFKFNNVVFNSTASRLRFRNSKSKFKNSYHSFKRNPRKII